MTPNQCVKLVLFKKDPTYIDVWGMFFLHLLSKSRPTLNRDPVRNNQ